ncbi:cation:proton antiporter [Methanolobus zinderi]|uniref:Cation:proton antiporter n=1 Tax=Methanolobus zinderi TaxID=536044 RepID=A0A7D5EHE6_9EURY|nr:cation:proton antiporter [Methanolobus zinderi]QLC50460.1 cation:proton antiporter [Methanolobus zinderi]
MELTLLTDIGIIFGLSMIILLLFHRMKLSSVLGFLVTGILAGPHGLGIITGVEEVEALAEIGIILLLFTIGIEMSLKDLWDIKKAVLAGGGLQVAITTVLVYYICIYMGLSTGTSIFMGFLVSLSSTAIVLKLLQEKGEIYTPYGKTSLGILIFQDIIIVPMILLTPILAGVPGDSDAGAMEFLLRGLGIILLVVVSARWIMPALLFQIVKTRNKELFLVSIIFIVLATAWLTSNAGLSLALGAFLAGLIISESEYSHQAIGNIMPFKDIFMSFFFVSIGMLLDVGFFTSNLVLLFALAAVVLVLKSITIGVVTFLLGYPFRTAFITGLGLSQVGEFSFVLAGFGLDVALINGELYQTFLAVSILTMAATPFVITSSHDMADRILQRTSNRILINGIYSKGLTQVEEKEDERISDHLIVIGYGFNGKTVSNAAKSASIPYVVIETNPETVRREKKHGEKILYGDATHEAVLESANIHSARILVVGISDYIATRKIVEVAKRMNPDVYVLARTRYLTEMKALHEMGADEVIPEEYETSVEIFVRLLKKYLVPEDEINRFTRELRANGYCMLRKSSLEVSEAGFDLENELPGVEVLSLRLEDGCNVHGHTLRNLDMRMKYGVTLLAIRRGEEIISNPDPDTKLLSDDICILMGKPDQLFNLRKFFESCSGSTDQEYTEN